MFLASSANPLVPQISTFREVCVCVHCLYHFIKCVSIVSVCYQYIETEGAGDFGLSGGVSCPAGSVFPE